MDLNTSFSIGDIQMANRHMKRCLTLLIIRKCKSKLTIRYHLTPVRISILKKKKNNKCWWGCREKQTPVPCWYECKLLHQLWKTVWRFLKKLKVELSYNPSVISGFISEENENTTSERYMYPNIHSSITYNSQDMEST